MSAASASRHPVQFEILARSPSTNARRGRVTTPHGSFDTPAFMPVATAATMKGLTPDQITATGAQIILNNAYHLMLRPGAERMKHFGGSHEFMRWNKPILTDSGGFQAWSMTEGTKISEEGVMFRSFVDGSKLMLSPERSIEVQNAIGADIIMAFDDCPPARMQVDAVSESTTDAATDAKLSRKRKSKVEEHHARLVDAIDRTSRWLARCVAAHRRPDEQGLFGIIQGGTDLALRRRCVDQICAFDLPGFAIGGVAVGESSQEIHRTVAEVAPWLPQDKPRYLMGVGYERDIVAGVRAGIDMFDCVLPTRNGRKGYAFTSHGPLRIRNAKHTISLEPIDAACDCLACAGGFSRGYLRHLFMADEMLGPTLLSIHNLRHFQRLMVDIRATIHDDAWSTLAQRWPVISASSNDASGMEDAVATES
ncbi:MAG: tRNA guanosine(34) transglycosylase Tgt [Planctomycetota bacterium]|nr:MAG: tRNA guanosine(34) transglycosylase Tgt [Planctomycetota bacterium]RLS94099.1 MAG: tRNA guanosine(34) transglycosylase Tgt [Planctomycetota bacterium]